MCVCVHVRKKGGRAHTHTHTLQALLKEQGLQEDQQAFQAIAIGINSEKKMLNFLEEMKVSPKNSRAVFCQPLYLFAL